MLEPKPPPLVFKSLTIFSPSDIAGILLHLDSCNNSAIFKIFPLHQLQCQNSPKLNRDLPSLVSWRSFILHIPRVALALTLSGECGALATNAQPLCVPPLCNSHFPTIACSLVDYLLVTPNAHVVRWLLLITNLLNLQPQLFSPSHRLSWSCSWYL